LPSPEVLVLVEVRAVHDPAELAAHQAEARKQMTQRGGVVIGRGGSSFEGDPVGPLVVQRWRSEADFRAWQESEEYKPLRERRKRSADLKIAIVPAT
jgi:uncharacterized protein (DUF1330 family)